MTYQNAIQDISVRIPNIPVHVGAEELMNIAHTHIVAALNEDLTSHKLPCFTLQRDDVELCDRHGVPCDMTMMRDVIVQHFYKESSGTTRNSQRGQMKVLGAPVKVILRVRESLIIWNHGLIS